MPDRIRHAGALPIVAALALTGFMAAPLHAAPGEALNIVGRHETVWTSPPTGTPNNASVDGPLLGNGDMLATLSGPPEKLVVHLGKNDFWRLQQGNGNTLPLPVGTLTLQCADLAGAGYQIKQTLADATTQAVFTRSDGALHVDAQVLAQENLLLLGLTAEQRAFQVRCDLAAASGRGSVSSAGTDQGVPWIERSFPAGTVDVPTTADCAMQVIGSAWDDGSGRAQAAQFGSYIVNLGREQYSSGRWGFDGAIDEVAVYQVALTADEVDSLYDGTVPQTGLRNHWSMETLPPGSVNVVTVAGTVGSATDYQNSAGSYSNIGSLSMPLDVVSVAVWIKIDSTQTANYILSCGEWNKGVSLGLSGGKVRFAINGSYLESAVLPTGQWVHVAATKDNGVMKIWLNGALAAQNSASAGGTISVQPGTTTWLAVAMNSLFKSATPREDAVGRCAELRAMDIPDLQAAHRQWWAGYWDQSWIDIGDPVLEKAYYLGYHGMGACSRDPEFPPGLFGWVTTDSPSWFGDYHLNYNFQAPFYALASGNRLEQLAPHDAPVLAFMERAQGYANAIFGSGPRGVLYPVGIGPRGMDSTYNSGYAYPNKEAGVLTFGQRSNAAYCLLNMAEHWRATYDPAYGAKIYPFVKEVAAFWESYLVKDGGRYKIVGDAIHEGSGSNVNPILTLGLLRNAFDLAIDLSSELGVDAEKRVVWTDILGHLSGYTTQTLNGQVVFRYTESGTSWWNDNTLGIQHIYPAGALNMESGAEWAHCSLNTIDVMQRWFDSNGSNSFFPAAVRIGYEPRVILSKLREYAGRMRPNGFQQNNPHGIENLSTVPNTINEMLCMSHVALGYETPDGDHPPRTASMIRLFHAWPRERDARFSKLRAWGGFLVSSSLWAGEVQFVEILSERGRACAVRNPWPGQRVLLYRNQTPAEVVEGEVLAFPTSPGETIRMFPGEHPLPAAGMILRLAPPANREGGPVAGTNLSFSDGAAGWILAGGTSTSVEDGSSTQSPLPDGNALVLCADDPAAPVSISQSLGPAEAGLYDLSFWVADRRAGRWLNYKVELLAGETVVLERDSAADATLRPPNGSTSHPGGWGRGGVEGDWHQVRLRATVRPSLAALPLTLRITSTTRSTGDDGLHDEFALDAVKLLRLGSSVWPLAQELREARRMTDGSTRLILDWLSSPGQTYRVEWADNPGGPWAILENDVAATPPVNSKTVQFPEEFKKGFVRVASW
jgi:hypothetical protein